MDKATLNINDIYFGIISPKSGNAKGMFSNVTGATPSISAIQDQINALTIQVSDLGSERIAQANNYAHYTQLYGTCWGGGTNWSFTDSDGKKVSGPAAYGLCKQWNKLQLAAQSRITTIDQLLPQLKQQIADLTAEKIATAKTDPNVIAANAAAATSAADALNTINNTKLKKYLGISGIALGVLTALVAGYYGIKSMNKKTATAA